MAGITKDDIKKEKVISFRVPKVVFEKFEGIARKEFKSVSDYLRDMILEKIKKAK